MIYIILLNLNGILCESYIIVKINKSGKYNILFSGGIEQTDHFCYGVSMHIPKSMTINGNLIDPPVGEYEFNQK